MLPHDCRHVKYKNKNRRNVLFRRFLIFWGVVLISALVFTATATILAVLKVPIAGQFWAALIVGTLNLVGVFWLVCRLGQGRGA